VPYWKTTLVLKPFGFTVPVRVADVVEMLVGEPVVTVGATPAASVEKLTIVPL
jgi:hypothetical protein